MGLRGTVTGRSAVVRRDGRHPAAHRWRAGLRVGRLILGLAVVSATGLGAWSVGLAAPARVTMVVFVIALLLWVGTRLDETLVALVLATVVLGWCTGSLHDLDPALVALAGALQALGARVRTALGDEVRPGGTALTEVYSLDLSGLDPRLRDVEVLVAVNPHNVLCGEQGVARVFGPQKGTTPEQVETLSAAMERWAKVLERDTGLDLRSVPGSGASGA